MGAVAALSVLFGCAPSSVDDFEGGAGIGGSQINGMGKGGSAGVAGTLAAGGTGLGGSIGSGGSVANGGSSPKATGGGGTGIMAGQGAAAGTGGSAGTPAGGAGQGGMSMSGQGGRMANGGMPSMAGEGGAGAASGSGGSAGMMSMGGKPAAEPSAGCGKASPQVGSSGSPLMVSSHQYYVKLPTGYDANKPYPVVFMFNPTGNPINWAEQNAGFEKNGAKDGAIRVYPHPANSSNGWGSGDVSFFEPLYAKIIGDYCVDQARMFAGGESSGGDFVSILGCEHADKLRGVAPCATKNVNGYPLDASTRKCTAQVSAVVIHGKNDNVVGPENGPKTRDFYVALNHCTTMSPMPVQGYTDAMSNCVLYQGCDEGYPTYWCQHTDPEYSGTNHGWPHFAADFLWELWSSY
jgi:polyhydroxybutyrate depolymerase